MTPAVVRTYPHGVTSWVDLTTDDLAAASAFYSGLFGWTLTDAMPPEAPGSYLIATLDGQDVAALGDGGSPATWNTYVAVDDCDATTERMRGLGFAVTQEPVDAGPGGRTATLVDPEGAEVRLWQARNRPGAQLTNAPGAWNFSDLATTDAAGAGERYAAAFGWLVEDQGWSTSIRVAGYGDHLEATVDPDIRARQAQAPEGFADVIGGIRDLRDGEQPHWHVTFTVADRDASVAAVERLGGSVVTPFENDWVRAATVRDPLGAVFTVSQFAPQDW